MGKHWIGLALIVACVGTVGVIVWWSRGAPRRSGVAGKEPQVTYICTETREISTGPWQTTPAVNPASGRRTLMIAFYCRECKTWLPGPPLRPDRPPVWPRCPVHDIPLDREPLATESTL